MGTFVLIAVVVVGIFGITVYNNLVRRRNVVDQAFSTIDVQLTQRYDLIPKLVETVKQYMGHERSLLEDITRLRSQAVAATTPADRIAADNQLTRAMGQLNVTMENYPQLKASDTFVQLQRSLNEVEEQLAAARRSYNAAVTDYINAQLEKVRRRVVSVGIIAAALGAIVYSYLWSQGHRDPRLPIGGAVAIIVAYSVYEHRKLTKEYKHIVVRRVVAALGEGLSYTPESRFTKQDFLDMDLFEKRCEQWNAEDEICGRKNVVSY